MIQHHCGFHAGPVKLCAISERFQLQKIVLSDSQESGRIICCVFCIGIQIIITDVVCAEDRFQTGGHAGKHPDHFCKTAFLFWCHHELIHTGMEVGILHAGHIECRIEQQLSFQQTELFFPVPCRAVLRQVAAGAVSRDEYVFWSFRFRRIHSRMMYRVNTMVVWLTMAS